MKKPDFLNDLSQKLCDALPASFLTLKADIEKNFRSILNSTFNKLDLVTREEFDAQTKVLARTRKKIESLETEIKLLEKNLKDKK
jgi:BMFP domain-containing protein YqiC